MKKPLSRRDFMRMSVLAMGSLAARPWEYWMQTTADWPDAEKLGRVCFGKVFVRSKPRPDADVTKEIFDDALVVWLREVVGESSYGSRRWVETPDGYIYAPRLQAVYNKPNEVLKDLPVHGGESGFWGEVTVPYVDLIIGNPPIRTPSLKDITFPRHYYSQVVWIDGMRTGSDGKPYYRINQKFGTYGDLFWAAAEAFKPLTEDDIAPIHPDVENKKIVVNLTHQTLACYEGNTEVRFCRVSTGAKFDYLGNPVDKWSTPPGPHPIYRKLISLHMSGQTTGDYPAVPWTCFITGEGVAVHSTYWHNEYGTPRSHGCINVHPDDARFVFRWTNPAVGYVPGDVDISSQWPPTGTIVDVVE